MKNYLCFDGVSACGKSSVAMELTATRLPNAKYIHNTGEKAKHSYIETRRALQSHLTNNIVVDRHLLSAFVYEDGGMQPYGHKIFETAKDPVALAVLALRDSYPVYAGDTVTHVILRPTDIEAWLHARAGQFVSKSTVALNMPPQHELALWDVVASRAIAGAVAGQQTDSNLIFGSNGFVRADHSFPSPCVPTAPAAVFAHRIADKIELMLPPWASALVFTTVL